jgi:MFS family permease
VATIGLLGRMGDVIGYRKVLLWVLAGQFVGNALTGLAVDPIMIIAAPTAATTGQHRTAYPGRASPASRHRIRRQTILGGLINEHHRVA